MQLGRPSFANTTSQLPPEIRLPEADTETPKFFSDEEEDLIALRDAGHITESELEEQLAALGLRNTRLTAVE